MHFATHAAIGDLAGGWQRAHKVVNVTRLRINPTREHSLDARFVCELEQHESLDVDELRQRLRL